MVHAATLVAWSDLQLREVLPALRCAGLCVWVRRFLLQSSDSAYELLYWDPSSGKKLGTNLRNAEWHTWTNILGFDVMGIWPDGSDGTDINALDRGRLGAPVFDMQEALDESSCDSAFKMPGAAQSADGVAGEGAGGWKGQGGHSQSARARALS